MKRSAATSKVKEMLQDELPEIFKLALELAKDKTVAPSARAKLISDLFRAGELYERADSSADKEQHEMTAGEIAQALQDLQDQLEARKTSIMD